MNLKINNFLDNKSTTPQNLCHIFPDANVSTKMNTSTCYMGGLGAIAPESQKKKKCKKKDAFPFHVMMWIQIRARGDPGVIPRILFIKMVQAGAI